MSSAEQSSDIRIKGIRQGLLVTLGEGEWSHLLSALEGHLNESPAFFRGGRVALDVGDRDLTPVQVEEVRSMVARHQVELWALVSTDPGTQVVARGSGLVTDLVPIGGRARQSGDAEDSAAKAILVHRTLRSGQSLRHPGHIVIIGDVNPGAEVVAGGDIVVWGRVRGLVHAGALEDENAVICALELAPTQLRIASHIARSPEERPALPVPEKASICDGQIVAVPWPSE
ncbi:MAG: septum site-determining protein MinC [Anaerolineae bacterium]|jgi:septum site-determining protein MinC